MYKYSYGEIQEHCIRRNEHEAETDKLLLDWINKYYPNRYIVNRTEGQWEKFDCLIYDQINKHYCKVECKTRYFTMEQYNKYSIEGFCLSYDKINYSDVVIYFIPLTNEVLQIRTNKIKELLNENKIRLCQRSVNRYQYTNIKDKHNESLLLIPKQYWRVYQM